MTAEVKLRTLASADPTLSGLLASAGLFRWFDRQLPQGYIQRGACVRLLRVSTLPMYAASGRLAAEQIRVQLDVLDFDAETARGVAAAIDTWFGTVDLMSAQQFASPPTTPPQFPSFKLNQRAGMDYQLQPPAYVETLEYRVFNNLNT